MRKALLILAFFCLSLTGCGRDPAATAQNTVPTDVPIYMHTPSAPLAMQSIEIVHPSSTPTLTPRATLSPTRIPSPTPTLTPGPTPFTIVWMSDTQNLSRHAPEVFNSMRDWILQNREKENIQFVIHTGDVVDGIGPTMFRNAEAALIPVLKAIPGMVVSGNHDISRRGNQSFFTRRSYAQLVQKPGQTYQNGDAAYVTFRAADTDFLVFGLGYEVRCTEWMNDVIRQHPNHVVITVMHKGLQEDGRFFSCAKVIFEKVMPENPGFRLLLCGHMRGAIQRTDWFDDSKDGKNDRSVTSMMFNFQDDWRHGLGFIRLLRFDPSNRSIEVLSYSPWFDRWDYPKAKPGENSFVLKDAW